MKLYGTLGENKLCPMDKKPIRIERALNDQDGVLYCTKRCHKARLKLTRVELQKKINVVKA